jgi:tetratricopeptide (TPR) repeat protein
MLMAALVLTPAEAQVDQASSSADAPEETAKSPAQHWIDLGNAEMQAEQFANAANAFKNALKEEPGSKEARFGLGTVYIHLEQYREALEVLDPMTKEFPEDYFLKNNVAWLYATAKDHSVRNGAKAVALAQDALLDAPRDYHVWSTLSEAYYVLGDYEKAVRAAEEAIRLAADARATEYNMREYRQQVLKCRKAVQAMSLLE